LLRIIIIIKII